MTKRAKTKRELGARLEQSLWQKGWTHDDLANVAGLSRQTISRILNGHNIPEPETSEKLAHAFAKPVEFFEIEDIPPPEVETLDDELASLRARVDALEELWAEAQRTLGLLPASQHAGLSREPDTPDARPR